MKLMLTFILIVYCGVIKGQNNAIGAKVRFSIKNASTIWFIKLNKDQDLLDVESVIQSDYNKGGQVYLTGILDGVYAMVAARYYIYDENYTTRTYYTTHFNEDLILRSIVEVDSGEFVFTGKWIVKMRTMYGKKNKGDEVSQHFFKMLTGDIKKSSWGVQVLSGEYHSWGEFKDFQRSATIVNDFKTKALRHYRKENIWVDKIKTIQ